MRQGKWIGLFVFKTNMANARQVNTFFWDDSYIEELNPNGKLLFIYLITSPLTNIAGSFEISLKKICDHTGLSRSKVEEILVKFEQDGKFFYKDNWMLAANGIEHQAYHNEKIQKGIENIISASPRWVIDRVCIAYSWLSHLKNSLSHLKEYNSKESNSIEPDSPDDFSNPQNRDLILATWLDQVSVAMGAKSRFGLTNLKSWTAVCKIAIQEGWQVADLIHALERMLSADNFKMQYFKPEKVLDEMRIKQNGKGTRLQTPAEKLAGDEAQRKEAIAMRRLPPTRPADPNTVAGN